MTTQQKHPWRASLRTTLQAWVPPILVILVVVPAVADIILEETGVLLPGWLNVALAGVVTVCSAVSAVLARVMAIPVVDAWLGRIGLGSAPVARELEPPKEG